MKKSLVKIFFNQLNVRKLAVPSIQIIVFTSKKSFHSLVILKLTSYNQFYIHKLEYFKKLQN